MEVQLLGFGAVLILVGWFGWHFTDGVGEYIMNLKQCLFVSSTDDSVPGKNWKWYPLFGYRMDTRCGFKPGFLEAMRL